MREPMEGAVKVLEDEQEDSGGYTLALLSQRQTATGSWLSLVCTISCLHLHNMRLAGNANGKMTDY